MRDRLSEPARFCASLLLGGWVMAATGPARGAGRPQAESQSQGHGDRQNPELAPGFAGGSLCPSPVDTWGELVTLLPRERLVARLGPTAPAPPELSIVDAGATYRVTAAGHTREYADGARNCRHRARVAALFVALAIDPVDLAPPPAPVAPPPVVTPTPAPPPEAPPSFKLRLELAGATELGTSADERVAHGGVAVRAALGAGRFALAAGASALVPSDSDAGAVRVRFWRLPVDVGARATFRSGRWAPYAEIGASAALVSVRGVGEAAARTATALELGMRGAAGVRLVTRGRVSPFAALSIDLDPSPPSVFALPQGTTGRTPLIWIGAAAGVSFGARQSSR